MTHERSLSASVRNIVRSRLLGLLRLGLQAQRSLNAKPGAIEPVYDIVDAGPKHRFCTPFAVAHNSLGLGFGCGTNKFVAVARMMARLELTPEESAAAVFGYRDSNPGVVNRWRKHQFWLTVSANHGDELHEVPLRSGRTIKYFKPHYHLEPGARGPEIVAHTVKNEPRQLRRFYGGKLTENEVQATARDLLGAALVGIDKAGLPILLHAHDEVITEVDDKDVKDGIRAQEEAMLTSAEWAKGCPLAVETKTAKCYFK